MNKKFEQRSYTGAESVPKLEGERTIEGYAVVFERESRIFYDPALKKTIQETIKRGAITQELLERCDIKALLEHDKSRLLARCNAGAGSLTLTVDEIGVKYRFEAPNTVAGSDAVEYVKRGDLFGSSFAYYCDESKDVTYEKRSDGVYTRTVNCIRYVGDVSIVSDPAYLSTSVSVRSVETALGIEEKKPEIEEESLNAHYRNVYQRYIN